MTDAHTPGLLPCPFCGEHLHTRRSGLAYCETSRCIFNGRAIDTHDPGDVLRYNARAPDLLSVAESVVAWADQVDEFYRAYRSISFPAPPFVTAARAAIAKAKGVA